ncbi:uncharacterized protein [Chelonus insularis]|uniref:uncharacterized protein n=1 Tax=Chelonus insularis TaxID=460826 RepID=UPI0015883923|nr:uncharacterized protein LOC118075071 [Chelonus insularis]
MKSSICIIVFITAQTVLNWSVTSQESNSLLSKEEHEAGNNNHNVLVDCRNSDYRTYIKCLKRHRRHHGHYDHYYNKTDDPKSCLSSCGIDQCQSTQCYHHCYHRCLKRTKETTQIITQYETETECVSSECKNNTPPSSFPTTNITTNIDINNNINLTHPNQPSQFPFFFFFGFGYPPSQSNTGFNCGVCLNPFYKFHCDAWCHNGDNRRFENSSNQTRCIPPQCVGGTYQIPTIG